MSRPPIRRTLLDRAIEAVAPMHALRRAQARSALSLIGSGSGGYGAARRNGRLADWRAPTLSADAAILPDLPTLRDQSRDLVRNAPLATGAIAGVVTNVVGTGLRMHPEVNRQALGLDDAAADEWERKVELWWSIWSESSLCDITRTQDFYALQELALRSTLESGDVLVLMRYLERPREPFGLRLQLIEADRVSNPNSARDTAQCAGGVQMDENGAPTGYWIANRHPGDTTAGATVWQLVPAFGVNTGRRQVLHLFHRQRPGQSRGIPYLAPVIETLKQLSRYSEAEVTAAVVNSCFALTMQLGDSDDPGLSQSDVTDATGAPRRITEPGTVVNLGEGENIASFTPGRPTAAFDPFMTAMLRQVGVALEIPFEVLIKHFTASYSAARAALLEAWKFFRVRRAWLAKSLCQPVYEAFLTEAVSRQLVAAPGFLRNVAVARAWSGAAWIGPSPGQIDPLKEAQANELLNKMRVKPLAEITAETSGGDWERKYPQLVKERRMLADGGLDATPPSNGQTSSPPASPADTPADAVDQPQPDA